MGTLLNPENNAPPGGSRGAWWKGLFAGILFAVLVVGTVVWSITGASLLQLLGSFRAGRPLIHVNQPTVVRQISQLQRLETVKFTMDKIISGERGSPYVPKILISDRLLLIAHGEVIAGVDLSSISSSDVSVQGPKVSVALPKAQILVSRLDNDQTKVYSRDTGLFSSTDPNLETQVRQDAEHQLQQAALDGGILKTANDNARSTLTSVLKGLGFTDITFR